MSKNLFWRGALDGAAVQLAVGPFGFIAGAIAADTQLNLTQTMAWSVLIVAGAAQLAFLQMLADGAPMLLAVLTGFAINLRFVMYSAALAPHLLGGSTASRVGIAYVLTDQLFGISFNRYHTHEDTPHGRVQYALGIGITTMLVWHICTLAGYLVGGTIPPGWSLDFIIPICFIAIVSPRLERACDWAAASTAMLASLLLIRLPYNLNVVLGAMLGIAAGMLCVTLTSQRARE